MSAPVRPRTIRDPRVGLRIFVRSFRDGRLARAVRTDDGQGGPWLNLERHILDGPELVLLEIRRQEPVAKAIEERRNEISQAVVALATPEFLPDAIELDTGSSH